MPRKRKSRFDKGLPQKGSFLISSFSAIVVSLIYLPMPRPAPEIVTTVASAYLAQRLAKLLHATHRHTIRQQFGDGEQYYRVSLGQRHDVAGKDVVIVGSTHTDTDLLEIYRVGSLLAELGSRRRIFVIPFFGYSTMERAVQPGEVVTAKTNTRLLSSIPATGLGNTFILLDLHVPGLVHYFEGAASCLEVNSEALLVPALKRLRLKDPVIASADLGMSLTVQRLAEHFDTDIALISKARRLTTTKVISAIGPVKGRPVIIYDDMVRSGGSLIKAAQAYQRQGATAVYAAISHLALTRPEVVWRLRQSPIKQIITTNSHPMSQHGRVRQSRSITVVDTAPLFAQAIAQLART